MNNSAISRLISALLSVLFSYRLGEQVLKAIIISLFVISVNVYAGNAQILSGATVTKLSSTTGNTNAFWIEFTGGAGECASAVKVFFKEADAGHPDIFKRSYSAAMTALAAGLPINVHRYVGEDCDGVSIELIKQ